MYWFSTLVTMQLWLVNHMRIAKLIWIAFYTYKTYRSTLQEIVEQHEKPKSTY